MIMTRIEDKNGIKVKAGDTIAMPYITPFGKLTDEEDFRCTVVFDHGCLGYYGALEFIPLFQWQKTRVGDYVSNKGNKVVYTREYPFWVV